MALSPNISLQAGQGVPQFDPMGASQKALALVDLMQQVNMRPQMLQQQLASAKAAEDATRAGILQTQAATAGATLTNEQTARSNRAKVRLGELAKEFASEDPTTKKIRIDHNAVASKAAAEGLDPEQVFTYMEKGQKQAQEGIKTESDARDYALSMLGTANNMIRVQTDPGKAAGIANSTMKLLSQAVGPEKAKEFASTYWQVPEGGAPDAVAAGQHFIDQSKKNAEATIAPQQAIQNAIAQGQLGVSQGQLGVSQEQTAQGGAAGVTSPDARDPKSAISRAAQAEYVKAGGDATIAKSLSAATIQNMVGVSGQVAANVVPAGVKGAAAESSVRYQQQADVMDALGTAAAAANKYPQLTPAVIIANKFNQALMNDPAVNTYVTKVREAQAMGLPIDQSMGPASIAVTAKSQAKTLRTQATTSGNLTKSPTFSVAPGTGTVTRDAPPAAAPKTNKGVEITRNGVKYVGNGGDPNKASGWDKK